MSTPMLTSQMLRLIAEKLDALAKANVDVSEFRLDGRIVVRVTRQAGTDQRDGDTYHVTQILVDSDGRWNLTVSNGGHVL